MDWDEISNIPLSLLGLLTPEQAWHYGVVPCGNGDAVTLLSKAGNASLDELEALLGKPVQIHGIGEELLARALATHYRTGQKRAGGAKPKNLSGQADLLAELIGEAHRLDASDIHLEPFEHRCRVRFRMDGHLVERFEIPTADYPGWVNRIKVKSGLDIAEKRLPQDGRILHRSPGGDVDIRVSVLPTLHGEKVVMRLLGTDAGNLDLSTLGFSQAALGQYLEGVKKPQGMVLISGPTGSGKTTTLYSTLQMLNRPDANIMTIEDPIEYTLEGINQVQLKENIGLGFAAAMRAFLRQDPDIIMVGEIRDKATAEMAIRASLTGHLVLSTIHTNSAWGITSRLADMGVPPYLLAETLNTAVAQRLVRKLCPVCKSPATIKQELLPGNYRAEGSMEVSKAVGCPGCHYTGYKGRMAVYEVIPIGRALAKSIREEAYDISGELAEKGVVSLADNAFRLLETGVSSLEEVYPILASSQA